MSISATVTIDNPVGASATNLALISSNALAAFSLWSANLAGTCNIEIAIDLVPSLGGPLATGGSFTTFPVETIDGIQVYAQGAAYEINTGDDPNGNSPDIEITLDYSYVVSGDIWLDPTPTDNGSDIPANAADAVSVLVHEIGHGLFLNGWLNDQYLLPDDYESTFDKYVIAQDGQGFFAGAQATALYGGPVPLSSGHHLDHQVLDNDVMDSIADNGVRTPPTALDFAILADTGVSLLNEPSVSVQQEIVALYVTLYGLAATQTGIAFWIQQLADFDASVSQANAGAIPISLADQVYLGQQMTAGSPVVNGTTYFQTLYPASMTDLAYVKALYQNMSGFDGTAAGNQFWLGELQDLKAENGGNATLARQAIVGRFTHDFYDNDLTVGAAALGVSASDYALLVDGQQTLKNKVTVAQYWANETALDGDILNFTSVTSASFAAAQDVLVGVTSDAGTVSAAITGISNAVTHHDLNFI